MAYTRNWSNLTPTGAEAANTIDDIIREFKVDIQERISSIVSNIDTDPLALTTASMAALRNGLLANRVLSANIGLIAGTTNPTDLAVKGTSPSLSYQIGALGSALNVAYIKTGLAIGNTPIASGGAGTVPINTWAVFLFSLAAPATPSAVNGAITVTNGAANYTTGYASEALALAATPATPANQAILYIVTVKTAVGLVWISGTDALATGASGNPASTTNYYTPGLSYYL